MSSKYPPVKNSAYTFRVYLFAQDDNQIQQTVTLAAGDFQSSGDGGAFGNLATLPSESPAGSGQILVSLSAGEMNYDEVTVRAIDAAGAEWHSAAFVIHTAGQTFDAMEALIDDLESRLTAARAGYLDNLSGGAAALEATAQSILTDTGTTLDTLIKDIPTNSEFEARTIAAANYATASALDAVDNFVDTEVAAVLAAVDTEVAAIKAKTDNLPAQPAAVGSAMTLASGAITAAVIATNAIDADALATDAVTEIQSGLATAVAVADIPTNAELAAALASADDATLAAIAALNNIDSTAAQAAAAAALAAYGAATATNVTNATSPLATGAALAALNNLSSAGAQAAAAAALTAYDAATATNVTNATSQLALEATVAALNNIDAAAIITALETETLPDSYSADGAQPTYAQALLEIRQFLMERGVINTTLTVNKPDGTTPAFTLALDDDANPTSISRAS